MKVVALAGGVGGAKLADGLAAVLTEGDLSVVVNVADDFDLYGLRICPDLDTVMYNLAGLAPLDQGWGIAGDTWQALSAIADYGESTWFQVGDKDFATHILRSEKLSQGQSLSEATAALVSGLGLKPALLPVSDDRIATFVTTEAGELSFQEFFVKRHHQDQVTSLRYEGIEQATPTREVADAIDDAELIVICPSNPFLSVEPILAVGDVKARLEFANAPVVAVSPIVGGKAIKGPADQMLTSLGFEATATGVARMYSDFVDGFVVDTLDASHTAEIESLGMSTLVTDTVMNTRDDRIRLAGEVLQFGQALNANRSNA